MSDRDWTTIARVFLEARDRHGKANADSSLVEIVADALASAHEAALPPAAAGLREAAEGVTLLRDSLRTLHRMELFLDEIGEGPAASECEAQKKRIETALAAPSAPDPVGDDLARATLSVLTATSAVTDEGWTVPAYAMEQLRDALARHKAAGSPMDYRRLLKRYMWHVLDEMEAEHGVPVSFVHPAGEQEFHRGEKMPAEDWRELEQIAREVTVERDGQGGGQEGSRG